MATTPTHSQEPHHPERRAGERNWTSAVHHEKGYTPPSLDMDERIWANGSHISHEDRQLIQQQADLMKGKSYPGPDRRRRNKCDLPPSTPWNGMERRRHQVDIYVGVEQRHDGPLHVTH